jgi:hypothetical protein
MRLVRRPRWPSISIPPVADFGEKVNRLRESGFAIHLRRARGKINPQSEYSENDSEHTKRAVSSGGPDGWVLNQVHLTYPAEIEPAPLLIVDEKFH